MDFQDKSHASVRASLELLYHVSREFAAALDLRTVLERVLFLSLQNVGAVSGSILVLDDNCQPVETAFLLKGKKYDQKKVQLRLTFERGMAGWVARNRQAVLISDTSQDERWYHRPDDDEGQTGAKSAVSVPIQVRDQLVGVITLVHSIPGLFTLEHLHLVQAIADQAGIAILNARLYEESQRQARSMTAVAESAAVITGSLNLDVVLQRILEQASQALRVEVASLALIDPQTTQLEFRASTGTKSQSVVGLRLSLGQGIAGWVAREGIGVVVPNAYKDARFYQEIDRQLNFKTEAIACAPIRSDGQVIGIVEVINPVGGVFDPDALLVLTGIGSLAGTAIRHAQLFERLQSAHERYRELFEASIDPILITDWQGYILEANRTAEITTGLGGAALHLLTIDQFFHIDQIKVGPQFDQLVSGETISYESVLHSQTGRKIPIEVYARAVNIDGVSHIQWILREIAERKNLDRLRDDLIAMIYHDLRSPLANVVSSLDVLASMIPLEGEIAFKSLLNIAIRSTERIQRLTNSLLDINRLEAGQPVGDRQPADPLQLVRDASDAVSPVAQSKNIELEVSVPEDSPTMLVDPDMIRRVLVNLLENAIKFSPPGSKISVGACQQDDMIRMWVDDNGPGIPAIEQEQIFEKFTRLSQSEGTRGLGLGLAFCRLAVLGHGGKIWVISEPGSGASFSFTLPVVKQP